MSSIQFISVASSDTPEAKQADNVLNSKFASPDDVEYIKNEVRNFDTLYLPGLSDEEKAALKPSNLVGQGIETKQAEAAAIQAKKVQVVMEKYQTKRTNEFSTGIGTIVTAERLGNSY